MGSCQSQPLFDGGRGIGTLETLNGNGKTQSRPRLLRQIFHDAPRKNGHLSFRETTTSTSSLSCSTANNKEKETKCEPSKRRKCNRQHYQQQERVILQSKLKYCSALYGPAMENFVHCLQQHSSWLCLQEVHFTGACKIGNAELELFVQQAILNSTSDGQRKQNEDCANSVGPLILLKKLSITHTYLVGSRALRNLTLLLRNQPTLTFLDLSGHLNLFDGHWASHLARNRYAAAFDYDQPAAIQDFVETATSHPSLQSIVLTGTNVGQHTATLLFEILSNPDISKMSKLKHLHLDVWIWNYLGSSVMSTLLRFLPQMDSLDTLVLSSIVLKRRTTQQLASPAAESDTLDNSTCEQTTHRQQPPITTIKNREEMSQQQMSPTYMLHHIDFLNILYPNFNLWRTISPDTAWGFLAISYEDHHYHYYDELYHRYTGDNESGLYCCQHCCFPEEQDEESNQRHQRRERGRRLRQSLAALSSYEQIAHRWKQRRTIVLRNQLLMGGLPLPQQRIERARNSRRGLDSKERKSCPCIGYRYQASAIKNDKAVVMNQLLPDWKTCWLQLSERYSQYWPYANSSSSFSTYPGRRRRWTSNRTPGRHSSKRKKRSARLMPLRLHHSQEEEANYNFKACALYLLLRERLVPLIQL